MQKTTWFFGLKYLACLLLSVVLVSCGGGGGGGSSVSSTPEVDDPTPAEPVFELVWADEFTENSPPNWGKWTYDTGYGPNSDGWGNDEWQLYTSSEDNVHVEDGHLVITARCPSGVCGVRNDSITSGRIKTQGKFSIKYGKVQARIKAPSGMGMWSAFWMLGNNFDQVGWPKSGEIDIMELHFKESDNKTNQFVMHWWDDSAEPPGWTYDYSAKSFETPLTDDFHVYEMEWDENRVIGRIDGVNYFLKPIDPETMSEFLNDFFLILNVAVGGNLGGAPDSTTVWPQEMLVDWVRVYSAPAPSDLALAVYSETITDLVLHPVDLGIAGGAVGIEERTDVPVGAAEGENVLAIDFDETFNEGWGGFYYAFDHEDISQPYTSLVFSLNTAEMTSPLATLEVKLEGGGEGSSVNLSAYAPAEVLGDWSTYSIPLSDFSSADLSDFTSLGFWHPKDAGGQLLGGTLYVDNIYFLASSCGNGEVNFDQESYFANSPQATVMVSDLCARKSSVVVTVENENSGEQTPVDMWVKPEGYGLATVNFGQTDATTDTIEIFEGDILNVTYTDTLGAVQTDSVTIGAPGILGCMDPDAANYNPAAQLEDGSCTYAVNFAVNTNCSDQAAATDVRVTGPFCATAEAPWGWTGACPLSDENGDGIWTGTYVFAPGDHEYKFMVGEFDPQEDLYDDMTVGGGTCAPVFGIGDYGEYANRVVHVTDSPVSTEDSFGSCDSCLVVTGCPDKDAANYNPDANTDDGSCQYNVDFAVDMSCSDVGLDLNAYGVNVRGPWGWDTGIPLSDVDGDDVWTGTVPFPADSSYEYKYVVGNWDDQEDLIGDVACAPIQWDTGANREFSVADAPVVLADTYGTCSTCSGDGNVIFSVDMNCSGVTLDLDAYGVNVRGPWSWDVGIPLADADGDGVWTGTYQFPLDFSSEYKYVVGNWADQEDLIGDDACAPIQWDTGANRVLSVDGYTTVLADIYGTCESCAPNPPLGISGCTDDTAENYDPEAENDDGSCEYSVTFNVDTNCTDQTIVPPVAISGPFCGWCGSDAFPLEDNDGDGIWSATYVFPVGTSVEYKYMHDSFGQQEDLVDDMVGDGACAPVTDYSSYANRLVNIQGVTILNDTYGQCEACP